jgi:hypothetical protein
MVATIAFAVSQARREISQIWAVTMCFVVIEKSGDSPAVDERVSLNVNLSDECKNWI